MAQLGGFVLATLTLVAAWLWSALRWRRYTRFIGFAQPKTSIMWGNMRTMHEQIMTGGSVNDIKRHSGEFVLLGTVFTTTALTIRLRYGSGRATAKPRQPVIFHIGHLADPSSTSGHSRP